MALAAVRVSRAELSGRQLRIEGTAIANRTITVNGVAMGASDSAGNFKIQNSSFDHGTGCIVQVNDGSATSTFASLTGCSTATPPPPGATGTVGIVPGGNGHARITSTPAGIDCILAASGVTGPCTSDVPRRHRRAARRPPGLRHQLPGLGEGSPAASMPPR